MSNSPLIDGTLLSPNHSGKRVKPITKIAIHMAAGVIGGKNLANVFVPTSRRASATYNLGSDGKLYLGLDESNRPWTTSSAWCDQRAVTIEVGNSRKGGDWPVSEKVYSKLLDLVYDICKRNNIYPCTYTGDRNGTLQKHNWYSDTLCPGPWLDARFPEIAKIVTARLDADRNKKNKVEIKSAPLTETKHEFLVKITAKVLNVRNGAGVNNKINTTVTNGNVFTIIETKGDWGKLKSGAGWIHLGYTRPIKSSQINKGDMIKIIGSMYATGQTIPVWVKKRPHKVSKMEGNKVLLGEDGGINSWVYLKDISK